LVSKKRANSQTMRNGLEIQGLPVKLRPALWKACLQLCRNAGKFPSTKAKAVDCRPQTGSRSSGQVKGPLSQALARTGRGQEKAGAGYARAGQVTLGSC